jgi:serine/threonine protein kinase
MIDRLEALHSKKFIHRDIKPENFVVGVGKQSKNIYLIDFGLSKVYEEDNVIQCRS